MANEKILNTRIQLKYDSYEKWNQSSVVLKAGEIAIAHLGPANKDNSTHASGQHPVLIKVGDDAHTFAQLPWLSAIAADVYAWAKKENPDWNDFPALPITVIDNGTGKFVTDVEYGNNQIVISRSDVDWDDVKNAPDFALKTDLPTELGVMSVAGKDAIVASGDANVEVSLALDASGNVALSQSAAGLKAEIDLSEYRKIADDENTVTTISAGNYMGTIEDNDADGNHAYVIHGKDWSGEIATALADAKKYADDNDTDTNTAHTHTAGDGLKLTGNGGVDGIVDYSLNLTLELENGNIVLCDKDDSTKVIATLDAAELLEDSYLNDVEIIGNELQFTWKMDDGSTKTDKVDLTHLVDVYSGEDGNTVKVEVNGYKISAEVKEASLTDAYIAANAAIAETKLAQDVQDALALARTALQSHQDITGKADKVAGATAGNFASLDVNGNLTDSGKKASDFAPANIDTGVHAVTLASGTNNGTLKLTIDGTETDNIAVTGLGSAAFKDEGAFAPAADYALKSELPSDADYGVLAVTGDEGIEVDSTDTQNPVVKIADHGISATKLKADKDYAGEDAEVWVFYCGTSDILV